MKEQRLLASKAEKETNEYAQIGVPFYIIINEANHRDGQAPPLYGYVLSHHQYILHGEPENET